jgi:hypothetical protein
MIPFSPHKATKPSADPQNIFITDQHRDAPGSVTVVGSIWPFSVTPVTRDCSTKLLCVLTRICW